MNVAVAALCDASAFPPTSVSPMVTVYVPGCFGTATSILTSPVCCGWSAGSVCGRGELVSSWPWLLRSSQMRPTEPGPLAVHARVPMFVMGTATRDCVPTSTAIPFFATWYRAFADGSRTALYTDAPTDEMKLSASSSSASQVIATTTRGPLFV